MATTTYSKLQFSKDNFYAVAYANSLIILFFVTAALKLVQCESLWWLQTIACFIRIYLI